MNVLAFDLATVTGIAYGAGPNPTLETETLGDPGDNHDARFAACLHVTNRLIKSQSPDLIVIETPITGKKEKSSVSFVLIGLRACVMGVARMKRIPTVNYTAQSVRKHFIGNGKLPRAEAKRAVMGRCAALGWPTKNDNEADAAALWDYARAKHGLTSPLGLFDGNRTHEHRRDEGGLGQRAG